ncbi:hypothetical protein Golomagni_05851 [Golovinomyces magnicellulatus]|nr:hypothetical protein Golomagni_05851 [Golovinomyces magnicellulatus]
MSKRLALKRQVIGRLDQQASKDTIIASNSSSYSCSDILDTLSCKHPSRILSAHTCESKSGRQSPHAVYQ